MNIPDPDGNVSDRLNDRDRDRDHVHVHVHVHDEDVQESPLNIQHILLDIREKAQPQPVADMPEGHTR
ncbi:MAG: hypothetical protein LR011_10880 [Verrucomicrobia bacterium]|nr:hypothetical protein [Verrucomicrobiota bacterium]